MSYWLEDADGKYLGDLASNVGIGQLRKASRGPLASFLASGEANGSLVKAIQEEALAVPSLAYVARLLEGAKPPVYVTDGCGSTDDDDTEPTNKEES
jgi:hypothetical protein